MSGQTDTGRGSCIIQSSLPRMSGSVVDLNGLSPFEIVRRRCRPFRPTQFFFSFSCLKLSCIIPLAFMSYPRKETKIFQTLLHDSVSSCRSQTCINLTTATCVRARPSEIRIIVKELGSDGGKKTRAFEIFKMKEVDG